MAAAPSGCPAATSLAGGRSTTCTQAVGRSRCSARSRGRSHPTPGAAATLADPACCCSRGVRALVVPATDRRRAERARAPRAGRARHSARTCSAHRRDGRPCAAGARARAGSHGRRVIVAHCKGGLVGKHDAPLRDRTEDRRCAGSSPIARRSAGRDSRGYVLDPACVSCYPGTRRSSMLGDGASVNAHIVSVFGTFDPHVPDGSALDGAMNVQRAGGRALPHARRARDARCGRRRGSRGSADPIAPIEQAAVGRQCTNSSRSLPTWRMPSSTARRDESIVSA